MFNLLNTLSIHGFSLFFALFAAVSPINVVSSVSNNSLSSLQTSSQNQDKSQNKSNVANVSPSEIISQSKIMKSNWSLSLGKIERLLEQAKSKKDIMKINCIEPKVKSMKFWISEGNSSFKEISHMYKTNGIQDRLNLLYQKIKVINNNIGRLLLKALRCVGDSQLVSSGEIIIIPDPPPIPDVIPPDPYDPTYIDYDPVPENPDWSDDKVWPYASPYK